MASIRYFPFSWNLGRPVAAAAAANEFFCSTRSSLQIIVWEVLVSRIWKRSKARANCVVGDGGRDCDVGWKKGVA